MGKRDLIVISSYPEMGGIHSFQTVGVASYTKLLLRKLSKVTKSQITVLGEILDQKKYYSEEGIEVERIWRRGGILSLLNLFYGTCFRAEKVVIISFEINMFGGYVHALIAILGMIGLKICGKKVILILHQAPDNLNEFESNGIVLFVSNIVLKMFYILLRKSSQKIIVFEEYLRKIVGGGKVAFIPHLIEEPKYKVTKIEARKKLGWDHKSKYAVVFGYVAPYKGILELMSEWPEEAGYKLVIAGGINPNHRNNSKILQYYDSVKNMAKKKDIEVTGYVEENLIGYYYSASDVIIIPYRKMFSSSGPLALAWSFQVPILMSKALEGYLQSQDISASLTKLNLESKDVFIEIDNSSLTRSLCNLEENMLKKYTGWGELMILSRSANNVAKVYAKVISDLQEDT